MRYIQMKNLHHWIVEKGHPHDFSDHFPCKGGCLLETEHRETTQIIYG